MSLFNLSPALQQLSTATITVRRPNAVGFGTDGAANTQTFTTVSGIRTSFQNLRADELEHMPEGDRTKSWVKIWPQMPVLFGPLKTGDRIDHPTRGTYIVQEMDDCVDEGGFTGAFARKLGDGES